MPKFNLGKFNLKSNNINSVTSTAPISIGATCKDVLVKKYTTAQQTASISFDNKIFKPTNIVAGNIDTSMTLNFSNEALPSVFVFADTGEAGITFNAEGISALFGTNCIGFKNLNLKPGEEIEINMCNLTATKNGENAMHLLTSDCDFFDFLVGDNNILIEGVDTAEIDIQWKDKWL